MMKKCKNICGTMNFSYFSDNLCVFLTQRGQAVAHLVEATNREVAGSILDSFIRIFHRYNPSGRTMVLGSTLVLRETGTWRIKAASA
jgi:hypothetical protein